MLKSALVILRDSSSSAAHISVAAVAVAEAVRERLPLPPHAAQALWAILRQHPEARWATLASEAISEVGTQEVVVQILDTLRTAGCGVSEAVVALDSLAGPATAPHVTEHSYNPYEHAQRLR